MTELDPARHDRPLHLRTAVVADGVGVVEAQVDVCPDHLRIVFSTASRPVPMRVWRQLLEQVRCLPAVEGRSDFDAALPIGGGGLLDALRERCLVLDARAAGASVLATGVFAASKSDT